MSRLKPLLVALLVLAAGLTAVATQEPTARPQALGRLTVSGPAALAAGERAIVRISGANPEVEAAAVVVSTTAGSTQRAVPLRDGRGEVHLGAGLTASAGITTVWVIAGSDEAVAEMRVEPGVPVAPVVPLVGPKSIVADGRDRGMVVGLPSDRFGNPVADRALLRLGLRRPDGGVEESGVRVTGLVTWQRLLSGTLAGRTEITMTLGSADGPVADLDEVPGLALPFSLSADEAPRVADGRTLHVVRTDQLRDRFGNVLLDGTSVRLIVEAPGGGGQATAVTLGGRAEFHLQSPVAAGSVRLVARTAGASSSVLELRFAPAVATWPTRVVQLDGAWTIEVGPVPLLAGGWVPDGTEVVFADAGREHRGRLDAGRASFTVGARPSDTAALSILGVTQELDR